MTSIFISYRRDDAAGYTRAIFGHLAAVFGKDQVFIDVEKIDGGADFAKSIDKAVADCAVALVVIGRDWLECSDRGGRRLDQEKDFVRLEVAAVLAREDLAVIPVLVGGARMPEREELPAPLGELAGREAVSIDHRSFDADIKHLEDEIRKAAGLPSRRDQRLRRLTGLGVVGLAVVATMAYLATDRILSTRHSVERADLEATVQRLYEEQQHYWASDRVRVEEVEEQLAAIQRAVATLAAMRNAQGVESALAAAAEGRAEPASELFERRLAAEMDNEEAARLASRYLTLTLPSIDELLRARDLRAADAALTRAQAAAGRLSGDGADDAMLLSRLGYLHKNLAQAAGQAQWADGRDRNLALARRHFEASLAIDANNPNAANGIASVLITEGDSAGAIVWIERALELLPSYLYAWHDLALAHFFLTQEAIRRGDVAAARASIASFRQAYGEFQRWNGTPQGGWAREETVRGLERLSSRIDQYEEQLQGT